MHGFHPGSPGAHLSIHAASAPRPRGARSVQLLPARALGDCLAALEVVHRLADAEGAGKGVGGRGGEAPAAKGFAFRYRTYSVFDVLFAA